MTETILIISCLALGMMASGADAEATSPETAVRVNMETTLGNMVIELYPDKAPKTVENFLAYVDAGFYDGTIFHRIVPGFVVQGGGYDEEMVKKETRDPIKNEASNGLKNEQGSICMARTSDPHSATSQFFINLVTNRNLDYVDDSVRGYGYAVFGRVVEGKDVVGKISKVRTGMRSGMKDVPITPVVIVKVTRVTKE